MRMLDCNRWVLNRSFHSRDSDAATPLTCGKLALQHRKSSVCLASTCNLDYVLTVIWYNKI